MLVSGMIVGTAFTLFIVPSIYMLRAKTHLAIKDKETVPAGPRPVESIA